MSKIVAVISDLIFRTKVEGTGSAVGAEVVGVSSAAGARTAISGEDTVLVLVDMALPTDDAESAIRAAKEAGVRKVIAFYSHMESQLAESAQRCGADEVLPRSAFVSRLPELLCASA